jgi:S-adenosylmethionine:tRNA ribosyltransferase-isomerase
LKHPSQISISEYTYELPEGKIAKYPLKNRDVSKLLVFKNDQISEDVFKNIGNNFSDKTLLIFNDTKVIQARLNFLNENARDIEIFCLEPANTDLQIHEGLDKKQTVTWNCLVGNLRRWKQAELKITAKNLSLTAQIEKKKEGSVDVKFSWLPATLKFSEVLEAFGSMPIPPYLSRESDQSDSSNYQTVYSNKEGSVAAPTAGLHFTDEVLGGLKNAGIQQAQVTLHVGAGTFKPVKSELLAGHDMHAEWIDVGVNVLKLLKHSEQKQVIAVGTTSLRTIESLYWMGCKACQNPKASLKELEIKQWEVYDSGIEQCSVENSFSALIKWLEDRGEKHLICKTQILIAIPYQLKVAKGLITNFHQPQSTLLLLIAAVVGSSWKKIYNYAIKNDFRFLSYGDSSLLLK